MTQFLIPTLVIALISYGLGCFSTAYYLVRWRTGQDIRTLGSGTAGARNAGRYLGKWGFLLTFLGDALKGVVALWIARWAELPSFGLVVALLAVVAGHLWPVQLGGQGGKGASTGLGGIWALNFWLGLITIGVALLLTPILRSFTRAGMIATALVPVTAFFLGLDAVLIVGLVMLILMLLFAHRENIAALRSHTEPAEHRTQ